MEKNYHKLCGGNVVLVTDEETIVVLDVRELKMGNKTLITIAVEEKK